MADYEKEYCFYCGAIISRYNCGKGDHFPIPKRLGGKDTVPCCIVCHDMKDRFRLDQWDMEWISKVIQDFPKLTRETKIFLAKFIMVYAEKVPKHPIK